MSDFLSIKQVCRLTSIPVATLRNWELRYQILTPSRDEKDQRIYSKKDLELLKLILLNLKTGMTIGEINKILKQGKTLEAPIESTIGIGKRNELLIEQYYQALIDFNLSEIAKIADLIELTFSVENRIEYVYGYLLEKLGEDWAQKKIDVATEHFCSNHFRKYLIQICNDLRPQINQERPYLICSTPQNELHEGGLLLISALLKLRGYNIIYLGPNLATDELYNICKKFKNAVLLLSVSDPDLVESLVLDLKDLNMKVLIGGIGIRLYDQNQTTFKNIKFIKTSGKIAAEEVVNLIEMP